MGYIPLNKNHAVMVIVLEVAVIVVEEELVASPSSEKIVSPETVYF